MNTETCLAVMAHSGAAATIDDFGPKWAALGLDIYGLYPLGDTPHPFFERVLHVGESAHRGAKVLRRFVDTVEAVAKLPYTRTILIEYDCVPMRPLLPKWYDQQFTCSLEKDLHSFGISDNVQLCAFSPYIFTPETGLRFVESARTHIDGDGEGEPFAGLLDRWIAYALERSGLQIASFMDCGGCVHNMPHDYIVQMGFNWMHGYKSREQFGTLWKD